MNHSEEATGSGRTEPPAIHILRKYVNSPVFKIAVILYMLMVIYNIASIVLDEMFFYQYISAVQRTLEEMLGLPYGILSDIAGFIAGMGSVIVIFVLLPEILRFLGMGMFLSSARNLEEPSRETGGLSVLQAAAVIEGILYMFAVLLVFGIILMGMLDELKVNGLRPGTGMVYVSLMVMTLLIGFLVITYEVKMIQTIQTIKYTMKTGEADSRISIYVVVMNFVMSVLVLLGSLMVIRFTEVEGFIVSAAGTVVTMLITVGLLKYRSEMKKIN